MSQIQPDQANFLLHGLYLPSLTNEHGLTKAIIEAIPADKGDYRPDTVSKTAMELAWHIVASEMRFLEALPADVAARIDSDRLIAAVAAADLTAWYVENLAARFEKLTKLSNDQLLKIIDFRGMFQLPAVMYLNFVLHHSIHHRGQLSMYLRPMGAKVPSIYGESYDAAEARKAASQAA